MCGFTYTYNHVLLYFFVYVCVYGCSWKYREGGSNNDDQFTEPKVFLKGFIYLCTSVANEVTHEKRHLVQGSPYSADIRIKINCYLKYSFIFKNFMFTSDFTIEAECFQVLWPRQRN